MRLKEIIVGFVFPEIILPIPMFFVIGGSFCGWYILLNYVWKRLGWPHELMFLMFPLVIILTPLTIFLLYAMLGVFKSPTGEKVTKAE